MRSIALTDSFLEYFKIDNYLQAAPGGQKTVFIVDIEGKKIALKIIKTVDERLEREIKISEKYATHVGIPSLIRKEEYNGDTIILEEYIEGHDLSELIDQFVGDEKKVLDLMYRVGIILEPIWLDRYVHRDLKPHNIRICSNGLPVVLDFGIARALDDDTITAAGTQPLSWLYASPEQYHGKKELISYRTDFFCLAIIAYRLFVGRLPFGESRDEVAESFTKPLAKVNTGSTVVDNFCNAMFHINPSQRPRKIEAYLNLTSI